MGDRFDSSINILIGSFVFIAIMALFAIPGGKRFEIYEVNNTKYVCPKGLSFDKNTLTCYVKAIRKD